MHSILPLLILLKSHGKLVMVGAPENPVEYLPMFSLFIGKHIKFSLCTISNKKSLDENLVHQTVCFFKTKVCI